jgi:hypothetical protein
MSGLKLRHLGEDIDDDQLTSDFLVNVWTLDNAVIRLNVSNLRPARLPFHFAPYETVPGSILGRGVPAQMHDSQSIYNAAMRAEIDNMAYSVGPMLGMLLDKLASRTNPDTMYPLKQYFFENVDTGQVPMQFFQPQSNVQYMEIIKEACIKQIQKETSLPDFAMGIPGSAQHNRTAEGLAMQQNAALTFIRSTIANIDNFLTQPMVESLYHWNMAFNPDGSIKGDFDVIASGVQGAIAKDVLNNRLQTIILNGLGDEIKYWIKPDRAIEGWLKGTGMEDMGITNTAEQAEKLKAQDDARQQAQAQAANAKMQPGIPPGMAALQILSHVPNTMLGAFGAALQNAVKTNGLDTPSMENAIQQLIAAGQNQVLTPNHGDVADPAQSALGAVPQPGSMTPPPPPLPPMPPQIQPIRQAPVASPMYPGQRMAAPPAPGK